MLFWTGYILFHCLNIFGGQCNLVGVNFVKITVSLFCGKSCDQSSVNIASCKLKNKELCSETEFKSTKSNVKLII